MSQETEHAVEQFFKDPAVAKAVIDNVVRKKPPGWGRRSNPSYYKEMYGLALKEVADEMIKTREDQVYFYKDFPNISSSTLYLKIYQSLRYLIENLDDQEKTYGRWNEMIKITQEKKVGVRISFIEAIRDSNIADFKPRSVVSKDSLPVWKQAVEDYIENPKVTKPFHMDGLALTPDEMHSLRESLKGIKGIMPLVRSYEIKIIKTNEF